jgi:hypothetical protein
MKKCQFESIDMHGKTRCSSSIHECYCNKRICPIWQTYLNSLVLSRESQREMWQDHIDYMKKQVKLVIENEIHDLKERTRKETEIRFASSEDSMESRSLGFVFRSKYIIGYDYRYVTGSIGLVFSKQGVHVTIVCENPELKKEYTDFYYKNTSEGWM